MTAFWERALIFELGLGLLALVLGWVFDVRPLTTVLDAPLSENVARGGYGCVMAIPMLLLVPILDRLDWGPVVHIRDLLAEYFGNALRSMSLAQFAMLALAAGWGEELLFRGFLQQGLAEWWPQGSMWGAILIVSIAFAALHCVTWLYGVLAFLASVYLGWLFSSTGNLLVPIATHACYDFLALAYVARSLKRGES